MLKYVLTEANRRQREHIHLIKMLNFYESFVIDIMKKCVPGKDDWYYYKEYEDLDLMLFF